MALRDPSMLEFARMIDNEELATFFARENGILLSVLCCDQLIKILFAILLKSVC